jgi:hypothetical protein
MDPGPFAFLPILVRAFPLVHFKRYNLHGGFSSGYNIYAQPAPRDESSPIILSKKEQVFGFLQSTIPIIPILYPVCKTGMEDLFGGSYDEETSDRRAT